MTSRTFRIAALGLALALFGAGAVPAGAATLPPGPSAPKSAPNPVDGYSPYRGQTTCDPTAKPGTTYILNMLRSHWGGRSLGIGRACTTGGQSEHKEGRALDWGVNVNNPAEKAMGDAFTTWLTAVGPDGKVGYNGRRLGVMYVIWNKRIWNNTSKNAAWRAYTGASPHTDHVHLSLSWNGALKRNSWWTGVALPDENTTTRYVNLVYQDLFHRYPDANGLKSWSHALNGGANRINVSNAITRSKEFRTTLIVGAYRDFLGRAPDQGGIDSWLGAMAQGMTIQQLEYAFLSSQEYFNSSGGTASTWVTKLYDDVLHRQAGASEVQSWVGVLTVKPSRSDVARRFVLSTERLTAEVDRYYRYFVKRGIDPGAQKKWIPAIQNGTRTEAVIGAIVASAEYYRRVE